jgi:hypothetical protein
MDTQLFSTYPIVGTLLTGGLTGGLTGNDVSLNASRCVTLGAATALGLIENPLNDENVD